MSNQLFPSSSTSPFTVQLVISSTGIFFMYCSRLSIRCAILDRTACSFHKSEMPSCSHLLIQDFDISYHRRRVFSYLHSFRQAFFHVHCRQINWVACLLAIIGSATSFILQISLNSPLNALYDVWGLDIYVIYSSFIVSLNRNFMLFLFNDLACDKLWPV